MGYIYKVTNKVNGKVYIGKTIKSIEKRWKEHLEKSKINKTKFYNAINKYNVENFILEKIEECDDLILNEREQYWIRYYNSYENGYNSTGGGDGGIKLQPGKIEQIVNLYKQNYCIRDIQKMLNTSIETISIHLKRELNLSDEDIKEKGYTMRSKKQCQPVGQFSLAGEPINTFSSMKEAEIKTGICRTHISQVCNGRRLSAGGYKWKKL